MKQYVIDELRPADYQKIKAYLDETFPTSSVEGIYRVPLDAERLTDTQRAHTACQPFYLALDLEPSLLSCELLVRSASADVDVDGREQP